MSNYPDERLAAVRPTPRWAVEDREDSPRPSTQR